MLGGLTLSACGGPPESTVALSEPGETAYDERLVGDWYSIEEGGAWHLRIAPGKDRASLDITGFGVGWSGRNPVRWIRATAHMSEIDGETYYNVKRLARIGDDYTADEPPGFIIVRAAPTDEGSFSLRFMDTRLLDDLIGDGRVKGRRVEGRCKEDDVEYIMLDHSRPELIALIRELPTGKLFPEALRFRRLRPEAEETKETEGGADN